MPSPVYLDCNATAPIEPEVLETVVKYLRDEYGNAGSRTHEFGVRAKKAVERAREHVAAVVNAAPEEVIFTSGATESDNMALLGLRAEGERSGRKHLISTQIEHKAVLEPLQCLARSGFEVTLIAPNQAGIIEPTRIAAAMRADTLAVSVMQVNNETGVIQPITEIAAALQAHECYFHVDAAQGFGKVSTALRSRRIDLISVSGHKVYGPKGVGALIARRRDGIRAPLSPLMYGGGQERGLRAGTLPTALIAGLGEASRIAMRDAQVRQEKCAAIKQQALKAFAAIGAVVNGSVESAVAHTLNVSIPGVDSEAAMIALKHQAALSNGSACTSTSYSLSHVLTAMDLPQKQAEEALRFSWCHMTPPVDWRLIASTLQGLQL
jgi:cysteine desulfurase